MYNEQKSKNWLKNETDKRLSKLKKHTTKECKELPSLNWLDNCSTVWWTFTTFDQLILLSRKRGYEISIALPFHVSLVLVHTIRFEVLGESLDIVDINNWNCTSKEWQVTGLSCCHSAMQLLLSTVLAKAHMNITPDTLQLTIFA